MAGNDNPDLGFVGSEDVLDVGDIFDREGGHLPQYSRADVSWHVTRERRALARHSRVTCLEARRAA